MELANVWFYSVGGPLLLPPPDSRRTRTKRTGRPRRRRRRTISQLEPFPLFLSSGILNISLSRSIYRTRGGICKRDDPFGRAASDRPTDRPSVRPSCNYSTCPLGYVTINPNDILVESLFESTRIVARTRP